MWRNWCQEPKTHFLLIIASCSCQNKMRWAGRAGIRCLHLNNFIMFPHQQRQDTALTSTLWFHNTDQWKIRLFKGFQVSPFSYKQLGIFKIYSRFVPSDKTTLRNDLLPRFLCQSYTESKRPSRSFLTKATQPWSVILQMEKGLWDPKQKIFIQRFLSGLGVCFNRNDWNSI